MLFAQDGSECTDLTRYPHPTERRWQRPRLTLNRPLWTIPVGVDVGFVETELPVVLVGTQAALVDEAVDRTDVDAQENVSLLGGEPTPSGVVGIFHIL